jgi:hypothetical protein
MTSNAIPKSEVLLLERLLRHLARPSPGLKPGSYFQVEREERRERERKRTRESERERDREREKSRTVPGVPRSSETAPP